jgi:hypothetical protein
LTLHGKVDQWLSVPIGVRTPRRFTVIGCEGSAIGCEASDAHSAGAASNDRSAAEGAAASTDRSAVESGAAAKATASTATTTTATATAVAAAATTTAATVGQGDIGRQHGDRGCRQQSYHRFARHRFTPQVNSSQHPNASTKR